MLNKQYVQNLPKYLNLCEQNYHRLMKLMPQQEVVGDVLQIHVAQFCFELEILECAKYTTLVNFRQAGVGFIEFISPNLQVKLYHDAQVAETICSNYRARIKPSYRYPNPEMRQKDEKYQMNAFLLDWLNYCISHGRSAFHWDLDHGMV